MGLSSLVHSFYIVKKVFDLPFYRNGDCDELFKVDLYGNIVFIIEDAMENQYNIQVKNG